MFFLQNVSTTTSAVILSLLLKFLFLFRNAKMYDVPQLRMAAVVVLERKNTALCFMFIFFSAVDDLFRDLFFYKSSSQIATNYNCEEAETRQLLI